MIRCAEKGKMKKIFALILLLGIMTASIACSASSETATIPGEVENSSSLNTDSDNSVTASIKLEGDSITVDGTGVNVNESKIVITQSGTYEISGTLNDGQIIVESSNQGSVELLLSVYGCRK
jgi:type 1 fimbria pilin